MLRSPTTSPTTACSLDDAQSVSWPASLADAGFFFGGSMMRTGWKWAGLAAAAAAVAAALLWPREREAARVDAAPATAPAAPIAAPAAVPAATARTATAVAMTPEDHGFIDQWRARFGPHMADKHSRIKAIEQLIAYLMARYPDDWRERVRAFLDAAFPELAAELFDSFGKLVGFNDWLRDHRQELLQMGPKERRAALWAKRHETFGDDAEAIWAGERRNERVSDALARLDTSTGLTTGEKLSSYLDTVKQTYGAEADAFIDNRRTELMDRFLDMPTVQEDLKTMPPAQRSAALQDIRRGMGMDEEAVMRWNELDHTRDAAWDAGQRYMQERQRIASMVKPEDQQRALVELQNRTFGAEAETIRSEEESGFFRFARERRIGRE
jgi:hypothetical protein